MNREKIPIKKIFLRDERFRISYYFPLHKLKLSLKRIGLINPPLVTTRDGRLVLVSGWRRVLACRELSFPSIPVYFVEDGDELQTFLLAFYENLSTREFSLLEKAEILTRLKKFGEDEKTIIRHYLPLLDIPSNIFHFETYLTFAQFETDVKKAIYEKNMNYTSVQLLTECTPQERVSLLPLIMPLGQNKTKELLEDILEISKRDSIPVREILSRKELADIWKSGNLSLLQKADKIRVLLRRRRYPKLFSWKDSFDSLLTRMKWPEEIMIKPCLFFEEEDLTVSFTFKDKEGFRNSLHKLNELLTKKEFSKLFQLE